MHSTTFAQWARQTSKAPPNPHQGADDMKRASNHSTPHPYISVVPPHFSPTQQSHTIALANWWGLGCVCVMCFEPSVRDCQQNGLSRQSWQSDWLIGGLVRRLRHSRVFAGRYCADGHTSSGIYIGQKQYLGADVLWSGIICMNDIVSKAVWIYIDRRHQHLFFSFFCVCIRSITTRTTSYPTA